MSHRALNYLLCVFEHPDTGLEDELQRLLRIFKDDLPEETRTRINSIANLFDELQKCRVIHIDDLKPLKEALGFVGRQDLVENVEELERQRAEQTGPLQRYGASLQSNVIRFSRAVKLHCNFRTVGGGVVVVGAALILRKCVSLQEFMNAFTVAVLPAANTLRVISDGSVCFTVQAENLSDLQVLWQQYQDGTLQKNLQDFLVTEEINQLADSQEVMVNVNFDEQEYKETCLDMMITERKALQKEPLGQRRRRNSDSVLHCRSRDAEEEARKLMLPEGEAKEEHYFVGKYMEPERLAYVQRCLEKLQDTHSVTSETTDSGLGAQGAPSVVGTEEDSDISDQPRCGDLSLNTIKELSRRLENDREAWKNVCEAVHFTNLCGEIANLENAISFFPGTPVRFFKDVFNVFQLCDLVELLERPVQRNYPTLQLQRTLHEVRASRKTDKRPTTYHSNVAVLIIHKPNKHVEISDGIKMFFTDLNSDNDVTIIPGLQQVERERLKENLKKLMGQKMLSDKELSVINGQRMRFEKELKETAITEKVALETIHRWKKNQEMITFWAVFDFASVLSQYNIVMKKINSQSNKAKLIFAAANWLTLEKFPETLRVYFPLHMGLPPTDAVVKMFNKRWQTLDLCSMMRELRRTLTAEKISIRDNLSCSVRFKKVEDKDSA